MATKINEKTILRKVNRRRHPVTSLVQLANEYGINTTFTRSSGETGHSVPSSFRTKVLDAVGTKVYNQIRDTSKVRAA